MANSHYDEKISTSDDIQQGLKRGHQMNRMKHNDDDDDEEYDEKKGTQLLQNPIGSILKPKNNISTNDDIQQGLKRSHQMVSSRKGQSNRT
ncbi:unnamed protein product [Rotaria sp. Silwood1]|nr:unnamed protein product [Rotaria sp. Silwood1]